MNTQMESESYAFVWLQTGIQVFQGIEYTQPSPYCSLGVIFMGVGLAEVHEEPIPEELGDMPIVRLDYFGTNPLICTHHVTPVFRVELSRQGGGLHQIAEQDRELTALSFWRTRCHWWRSDLGGQLCLGSRLVGCQCGLRDGSLGVANSDQY